MTHNLRTHYDDDTFLKDAFNSFFDFPYFDSKKIR